MLEKAKFRRIPPPDYQVARAFHFTGEDLAVNRSGYMTRRQQGWLNVMAQSVLDWVRQQLLKHEIPTTRRGFRRVESVCGRIRLEDHRPDYRQLPQGRESRTWNEMEFKSSWSQPSSRTVSPEKYRVARRLIVETTDFQTAITEKQYLALVRGRVYRIYYDPARSNKILSLERIRPTDDPD
ncbi:MAG TPA: hypothetical protein VHO69_10175 [Phototrophicaceae bacterium]|nr:hypothetical protein [Phototrophicaceae bacterium]